MIVSRQSEAYAEFQSTHPVRGATPRNLLDNSDFRFQSTHPVRGATCIPLPILMTGMDFNPRTPCGVRPTITAVRNETFKFQSTHPVRGATRACARLPRRWSISIHAPRAGCDTGSSSAARRRKHFNPRTPCGVRPVVSVPGSVEDDFNPRTPCGVRRSWCAKGHFSRHFNPRTPCGVRPSDCATSSRSRLFQSTHPVRGATVTRSAPAPRTIYFNPRTPCGVRRFR